MQESSVYQHWLETTGKERYQEGRQEGKELGECQAMIEALYSVLEHKFDSFAVRMLITVNCFDYYLQGLERKYTKWLIKKTNDFHSV